MKIVKTIAIIHIALFARPVEAQTNQRLREVNSARDLLAGGFEAAFRHGAQAASDQTMYMVEMIESLGLGVERLVNFNAGVATWDQVLESVRRRREWDRGR